MRSNNGIGSPRRGVWKQKRKSGSSKRYLIGALATLIVAAAYCLASAIVLMRVQETVPPTQAAQLQERHGGLYGPVSKSDIAAYKLERYALRSPDILVVGSERLASLPVEAFATTAYNAAGAADSLEQLVQFIRAAVARHQPKSVLIGVDYWWFHPDAGDTPTPVPDDRGYAGRLIDPLWWLVTGKVSPTAFVDGIFPDADEPHGIGALAILNGEGWDPNGRYDTGAAAGAGPDEPAHLTDMKIAPAPQAFDKLKGLIDELNKKSIEVVLMIPPTATSLRTALAKDPANRFLPLWRDGVTALGQRVFDFSDPVSIGSSDCELLNSFSGGEVIYLRALDAIGGFGGTLLSQAIDRDLTASLISSNIGRIRIAELLPASAPEGALFQDGCDKDM